MPYSPYWKNLILDVAHGRSGATMPTTFYMVSFTTTPAADGTGGVECSGTGYSRIAVTAGDANWKAAASGQTFNANEIEYTTNGNADWGTQTAIGRYDAATAGNLLDWDAIASGSKVINNGDTYKIAVDNYGPNLT